MEPNEIQAGLAAAVEEVLETMCFTSVLSSGEGAAPAGIGAVHRTASVSERTSPPGGKTGDAAAPSCTAALRFTDDPSGGFRVSVPRTLARAVGAGFLGCDELEVSDAQAEGVVCEPANMICGSVLSRLESEATFQIAHPELVPPERGAGSENAGIHRWFDLGDGILTVSLELQPTV